MYTPSYFRAEDLATATAIIRANSFGILVSSEADGPTGTHLPFVYVEPSADRPHGTLLAHMARANPQWRAFASAAREVLVLFQGAHGYISPAWYPTLATKPHVPTWNYEAVHAYGTPHLLPDDSAALDLLHRMVDAYEPPDSPYRSRDLPADFLARNARAIVAFEIPIARLETKVKMSQNRDPADVLAVMERLRAAPDESSHRLAAAIQAANHLRQA